MIMLQKELKKLNMIKSNLSQRKLKAVQFLISIIINRRKLRNKQKRGN